MYTSPILAATASATTTAITTAASYNCWLQTNFCTVAEFSWMPKSNFFWKRSSKTYYRLDDVHVAHYLKQSIAKQINEREVQHTILTYQCCHSRHQMAAWKSVACCTPTPKYTPRWYSSDQLMPEAEPPEYEARIPCTASPTLDRWYLLHAEKIHHLW